MEKLLETKSENTPQPKTPDVVPAHATPDQASEIDRLLRVKRGRGFEGDKLPCPGCNIMIENTLDACPFCESDIEAQTALSRETMRRLNELSRSLDAEHAERTKEKP